MSARPIGEQEFKNMQFTTFSIIIEIIDLANSNNSLFAIKIIV
jgi:hypothetical protein